MGLLDGKVALVTGASRGIGKAIALRFASEGANIAFTDLKVNPETVDEIAAQGVKVRAWESNAASFEDTARVVGEIGTELLTFQRRASLTTCFLLRTLLLQTIPRLFLRRLCLMFR